MEYEVKKIMNAWETRCEYDQTPYTLCEYLEQIRKKQSDCLWILEEDGNTLYDGVSKERLDTLMQQWNDVFSYATMLRRRMSELLDEPFKRDLGTGAVEYLSHINLSDYQTENTVGLTSEMTYQDQRGGSTSVTYRRPYDSLTFSHFLGSWTADELAKADGGGAGYVGVVTAGSTMLENPSFDTPAGAVLLAGGVADPNMAMFANIFAGQYAAMEESGAFEESEIEDLQGYLDMLEVQGEYEYEYDSASTCVKIANRVLDLFVVPNLIEAALGQELLTGRELDNGERAMKVVVGVLNAVGMRQALSANGIVNVTTVEALGVIGKVAIVNGAADLTAYGVSWIGEELGLPMPVTVLLSLVLGITVDYELGCYVFRNGDGSILRRIKAKGAEEVLENGPYTSFADLMSPEDAERYLKFLETGSTAGLTEAEIAAIRKVDELLALERITYQDIVDMRNANFVVEGNINFNNPSSYLQRALKNQGLETIPSRLKEIWIEGDYKYTVRVHKGNSKYTDADSIYRVSRQSIILDEHGQGTGLEYLGMDGNWYHESVLTEFFKDGTPNPNFNEEAAKMTHIPISGGN